MVFEFCGETKLTHRRELCRMDLRISFGYLPLLRRPMRFKVFPDNFNFIDPFDVEHEAFR